MSDMTALHLIFEVLFWCPVYVLSPNKAWIYTQQGVNIIFVYTVLASDLFSCAYNCSNHVQQFADTVNPGSIYVFLLIPFSASVTIGLLFKPDKYMWER
jgi:hypothetical protein